MLLTITKIWVIKQNHLLEDIMQLGDEELMQKVKDGDMRAFDVLVRRWEHRLFNLVYKIVGDYEIAKDVRQEVFLRVYQASRRLKEVLVRLIGTYAPNIRQLGPQENVVVAVRGTGNPKQLQVKADNITVSEFNTGSLGGGYHIETHVDKPKPVPKTVKVPTVAKVDSQKSIVVTTTSDKVARGDTTLIIKVNKENIIAYKDGKLDFSGLINQAEMAQY